MKLQIQSPRPVHNSRLTTKRLEAVLKGLMVRVRVRRLRREGGGKWGRRRQSVPSCEVDSL